MTERNRIARELEQRNRELADALDELRRAQSQLVLDASHELRTPLTSLRTNLEVIRRIDELSVEGLFLHVTTMWSVLGAIDEDDRLTPLGWWGLPEAMQRAWTE